MSASALTAEICTSRFTPAAAQASNRAIVDRAWILSASSRKLDCNTPNCVGVLQSSFRDDADKIHARSTIALFEACAAAGVKRLVHISAVSAEADMATSY